MRSSGIRIVSTALFVTAVAAPGSATILTFDQARSIGGAVVPTFNGATLPGDYGDRASGPVVPVPGGSFTYGEAGEGFTPNVVFDFFSGAGLPVSMSRTAYGDLTNVVFPVQLSPSLNVRLTADPGFETLLYGFDLGGFLNRDWTISSIVVSSGSMTLFSMTDVLVQGDFMGPRHTSFSFPTPLSAQELLIHIDVSNLPPGLRDNVGLDNLRFGQVPEPDALLLYLAVGAVLAVRRRRDQNGVPRT